MSGDHKRLTIPPELEAEMTSAVRAFVESLLAVIRDQQREIDELRTRLGKTPQNSSLPPSSQHPHAKPVPPAKPRSPRKSGGQPGHPKHERSLIPTEQCDHVEILKPTACRRCGRPLVGDDTEPLRHQVWELPEIKPDVTEYQRHRLTCLCCGESTTASLPDGVPGGQSGPRLVAFVSLLMACFRQSKRRTAWFLETLLGQPCSTGLTVKLQNVATDALRPCYEELCGALPEQPHVHADESPTKQGRSKAWLWAVVATQFTVFTLRTTRAATVIKELLTEDYRGVVTCDRAKMYLWVELIQWCWAHLKRDFQAMHDAGGRAKTIGRRLLDLTDELFHQWHRIRDGTLTRRGFKRHQNRLYGQVYLALEDGERCRHGPTEATCRELLGRYDALWTFAEHPGVEPTNNAGERALRHAVIWRKLSFGTQSVSGSRFVETLLSVIETCRQQNRPLFPFVTDAVQRHFAHLPEAVAL
ncbi:MAG: IS66 family transposase [Phycisphaerae bacterium]